MASYQQNNDYQTFQVNPYQAPNQEMVQAIATRNQYWDSAASSIKYAYQNYLNLDLSRQDNHDKLNQLMVGVNEQLKQVTQTDISLGENYGHALSIFDPIIKDDNIMGDNAITRHYKDQFSIAQQYRIKDNGKGYSDTNVRDIANHLQDFVTDSNASNWRQHYSGRSFYSPYYDVSGEIRQIDKDFKPDVMSSTAPVYMDKNGKMTSNGGTSTGYMLTQTDKSTIASQYRAFLNSHLSDKAKAQLSIEGRVKYHDSIGALAQDYTSHNQEKANFYNDQIKSLNGAIAGATDSQKDQLRTQINNYKGLVDELNLENTKMKAGDFSNLTPYKDRIASQLYSDNYIDYLSKASARKDVDVKYTPDQVWKTMYQEDNENKRFNIARNLQWDIAKLKADTQLDGIRLKESIKFGFGGPGLQGIPGYPVVDTTNDEGFSQKKYQDMQTTSAKEFSDSVDILNRKISSDKGIDMNDTKVPQATRDAAFQSWTADPRNKNDVQQYYAAAQKRSADQALFGGIQDYLNSTLSKQYSEVSNYRQSVLDNVKQGQSVVLTPKGGGNSLTFNLSPQDIKDIINNNNGKFKLGSYQEGSSIFTAPGSGSYSVTNVRTLSYNGKEYKFNYGALSQALNKLDEGSNKYNDTVNKLLDQNITRIAGIEGLYADDKNPYYHAAHEITLRQVAGTDGVVKPEDVVLTGKDRSGDIYFKVQGDAHINLNSIKDKVQAAGGRYIKGSDSFVMPGKYYGFISQGQSFQDPRIGSLKALVDFRSTTSPNSIFNTPPQSWGGRNFQFKIDIQGGHPSYKILDPLSGAVFGADQNGTPFSTLDAAAAASQNLGTLTVDQYINFIKTAGGVPDYQPK